MNKLGDRKLINFRPVVAIALALAIGVCFSITNIGVSILKISVVIVIILVVASFEAKTDKRRRLLRITMWLLVAFMVGIAIGVSQLFFFTKDIVATFGKVGGTVESVAYGSKKVILNNLILNGASVVGKAEVTLDKFSNVAVGDIINAYGKIRGSEAINGEQIFTYYVSNNIKYVGECQFVEVVGKATLNLSQIIRGNVYTALVNNLEYQNAGIVMGMIFGETSMMNQTVTKAFQVTGLGHIFAVSGLNVGIFYTVCFLLFKKFSVVVKSVITIILVTLYVYICGMTVSATRALVMVVVSIVTQTLHFEIDSLTNLGFAMIISLLINPLALFSAGFALSFGAVLSLIVLRPQIARLLKFKKQSTRDNIAGLIGIQFVTLPLMSYYFSYISVFSFVINLFIIPIISVMYIINLALIFLQQTIGLNLLIVVNALIEILKSFLILIQNTGVAIIEYQFSQISLILVMIIFFILSDILLIPNKRKALVSLPFATFLLLTLTIV